MRNVSGGFGGVFVISPRSGHDEVTMPRQPRPGGVLGMRICGRRLDHAPNAASVTLLSRSTRTTLRHLMIILGLCAGEISVR